MNEALKIILSLSLSGALLILILFLLRPLFKERLSKRWQYYIWLVVIARLLLPFAPEINLMGALFQGIDKGIAQTEFFTPPMQQGGTSAPDVDLPPGNGATGELDSPQSGPQEPTGSADNPAQDILLAIGQNLWLGWLVVALILFIRKITIYQSFVKYIRAGCEEVADIDVLERFGKLTEQSNVKKAVELHTNSLISSPLLIGFFRPCIVLPTANLSATDFEYTILHELTHYKRRDMFYKWLVQLTICIHWFNPLVYLMGRDVNRACELSCDEAVIIALDPLRRRAYGDTLLNAMGTGGLYRDSLSSVTLNESKELLKERLDAIMKFKNPSKVVRISTAFLTIAIIFGATFTGAYALSPPAIDSDNSKQPAPQVPVNSYKNDLLSYQVGTSILFGQYNNQAIKWNVLSVNNNNEALLFAADILPNTWLPFDKTSNIWETSAIRAWLNGRQKGEFLSENNFTQDDREAIIQKHLSSGILGDATDDYVFLISREEYWQYNVGDVLNDVNSYWSRSGEANTRGGDNPGNVALFSSNHQFSGSFNASEASGIRPMMWVDLSALLKASTSTNQTETMNPETTSAENYDNTDTISVNIQRTDNLISAQHGRRYQVYGPFNGSNGDSISCALNNDIEARLEIIISGQGETVEGVETSNSLEYGKSFTATLSIDILNKNRQFYVFIGSDNISNLTGTISLPRH